MSDVWDLGDVGALKLCPVLRVQPASLISLPEYLYPIDTLVKKKKKRAEVTMNNSTNLLLFMLTIGKKDDSTSL